MRNDKYIALQFRKRGLSYKKIERALGIPRSTLHGWLSDLEWSQELKGDLARRVNYDARQRLRLINTERRALWERWREAARREAQCEFESLLNNHLFIAGVMLYGGEGSSMLANGNIRHSNTDARMVQLYTRFLRDICRVKLDKLRATLLLYRDLDEDACKKYWSEATGIPPHQFTRTHYLGGRHPTQPSHGICQVVCNDRQLKEKIHVWLDLFHKKYGSQLAP